MALTANFRMTRLASLGIACVVLLQSAALVRGGAPASEPVLANLKKALAGTSLQQIVLAVQKDGQEQWAVPETGDVSDLVKGLTETCRNAGATVYTAASTDPASKLSVSRLPAVADLDALRNSRGADAVVSVVWTAGSNSGICRLALVTDRKVAWNARIVTSRGARPAGNVVTPVRNVSSAGSSMKSNGTTGSPNVSVPPGGSAGSQGSAPGKAGEGSTGSSAGKGRSNPASPAEVTACNGRILEFVVNRYGRQVGDGQCWTLAAEALKSAGAEAPAGYDFGETVELADLRPGDVLHFYNARFVGENSWLQLGAPHHIAVVYSVQGSQAMIYHQNFNENRTVRSDAVDLATLRSGSITAYRAVPGSK